jgi:O-antigen ligase
MSTLTPVAWVAAAFLSASLFSHTVALRLILLLVGAGLAAFAIARDRTNVRLLPQLWLPFLLWAGWAALSVFWSVEPERTMKELRNEVVYTGLALWICFIGAQAPNAARIFLPVVGAAAAAVVAVALRDFWLGWEHYLVGLHSGPGDHSSALLTLLPCVAMAGWYGWRARWPLQLRLPAWILGLWLLVSAYFTLNRTVWLGFAVEFGLLGALVAFRATGPAHRVWSFRGKMVAGSVALAVLAGTAMALVKVQADREAIGAKSLQGDHRLVLWPQIIEDIGERPLTGYGFGRGLLRAPLREEFGALDGQLWHAHNIFLEALVQLGFPGLALLLLWLGVLLGEGWRGARHASDAMAAYGIALIGVVGGMLVRNMTDTLLVRQNALLFWGVVGVLLAGLYSGTQPLSRSRTA